MTEREQFEKWGKESGCGVYFYAQKGWEAGWEAGRNSALEGLKELTEKWIGISARMTEKGMLGDSIFAECAYEISELLSLDTQKKEQK